MKASCAFYKIFQDSFSVELQMTASKVYEIQEQWCLHFSPFKKRLHRRIYNYTHLIF